ncbi:MAG: hypothetical protein KC729_06455 [Candidatus Eisenbacteria bacterium]|uniref:Beta-ketoacyl synthase N-terminal domain-containing protein n=1 Tax=Eiseniibacteriota bacterium TaxID=2212470 RepID=A0A956LYF9_UNCEI|nr:hypothetical protein [Candidatus Eisenbacteria bacterium]
MKPVSLVATAFGAVSPIGGNVEQTCTSIRAGLNAFRENPFVVALDADPEWGDQDPIVGSVVPGIAPLLHGNDRLLQLAVPAVLELVERANLGRRDVDQTALLVALPEKDAVTGGWSLESLPQRIAERIGLVFPVMESDTGRCAAMRLATRAAELIAGGKAARCLLLGVDSFMELDRLRHLDETWRISSPRTKDGFIPGEAAVAVLLEPAGGKRPAAISLTAIGIGSEPNRFGGDKVSSGAGLQSAIKGAFSDPAQGPEWVLCDLNGESYRGFEWGLIQTRLGPTLAHFREVTHPADCTGDVGAATAPLLWAVAARAMQRGYAPGRRILVWTADDGPGRAAANLGLV